MFQIDINGLGEIPKYSNDKLEDALIEAGQNWPDRLKETIEDKINDDKHAAEVVGRYGDAFSLSYQENYAPAQAVLDIENISSIIDGDEIDIELYEQNTTNKTETRLKLYHAKTPLALSDVLPLMENMGLKVITELPFKIQPANFAHKVWIHDFLIETG